jgi:hypothetical protein
LPKALNSKALQDIDSCDNRLNDSARMALAMFAQIAGSFVLIAIVDQ